MTNLELAFTNPALYAELEKKRCDKIVRDFVIECAVIVGVCWASAAIGYIQKRRQQAA